MQNSKEIWKYAKRNQKDIVSIPALVVENSTLYEHKENTDCFNSYFGWVFSAVQTRIGGGQWSLVEDVPGIEETVFNSNIIEALLQGLST